MQTVTNTNYTLIPRHIIQQLSGGVNNNGEPVKCTGITNNNRPMINHTFDYSELLEYYAYR